MKTKSIILSVVALVMSTTFTMAIEPGNPKVTVHVAKISNQEKYLLSLVNQGEENVNVKIYDGENNLVHDQNVVVKGNFGLVYNLKRVYGTPTFEVTDKSGNIKTIKY